MTERIQELLENRGENYIFPFFWQRGESEETIREYMEVIYRANIRAVCIESRPHPDFCGEQWWHDMDIILDEARKRCMKVWILDDSHFPTGYANGAMADKPAELYRQSICCRKIEITDKEVLVLKEELLHPIPFEKTMIEQYILKDEWKNFEDDRLLSVYAVEKSGNQKINLMPLVRADVLEWQVPEGEWIVFVLHLSRNQGYHRNYINMMDRESCRVLIDTVYEPHYEHYKEDFGTTIEGFFSDEPELGNGHLYEMEDGFGKGTDYPWSMELEKALCEELGADYALYLGALWDERSGNAAKTRYAYMNAVTKLVKKDFSMQLGEWCRERGVKYIGHLIEDDNHHSRTGSSLGHYFRGLAGQDMAGIDDIGGQVFPQGEDINYNNGMFAHRNGQFYHYMLGKLASSAAAIEPVKKGNSMCEIFGNYGWSEGVRLEKYLADHFLVRGVNHYVPHAFSGKEYPDPECPPHFYAHGNNPQYRHFGCLMSYMNRVCHLISDGSHVAPVAVLYHGEGEWTGEYLPSDAIGHVLADVQIEYDYIPQDVFAQPSEYNTMISDGILKINMQTYQMVLIPYMQYITRELAEAAWKLKENHVKVLFVNQMPEGLCNGECADSGEHGAVDLKAVSAEMPVIQLEDLSSYVKKSGIAEVQLIPSNDRIRYIHYQHEKGAGIWMFVNEGTEIYEGSCKLPVAEMVQNQGSVYMYDAWENCIRPIEKSGDEIRLCIEPLKSCIVVEDSTIDETEIEKLYKWNVFDNLSEKENVKEKGFLTAWKRSICRSIDYPKYVKEKEVQIPDSLDTEEPHFSGFCRYTNSFMAEKGEKIWLEIEDAAEGVEVFLNQKSLGIQIAPPFRYDLTDEIIEGRNDLIVEVATTLERENSGTLDIMGNIAVPKSKSGITGKIELFWTGLQVH